MMQAFNRKNRCKHVINYCMHLCMCVRSVYVHILRMCTSRGVFAEMHTYMFTLRLSVSPTTSLHSSYHFLSCQNSLHIYMCPVHRPYPENKNEKMTKVRIAYSTSSIGRP